jgi:hypothetical protein
VQCPGGKFLQSEGERKFIARFLDVHDGRRGTRYLRRVEQMLITAASRGWCGRQ